MKQNYFKLAKIEYETYVLVRSYFNVFFNAFTKVLNDLFFQFYVSTSYSALHNINNKIINFGTFSTSMHGYIV
jgi:hypothetical protein